MEPTAVDQKNIAMMGEGFYSRVSLGPQAVIDNCKPLLIECLEKTQADLQRPLSIADFGAADGGTSLALMRSVVRRARRMHPQLPINVTYTDLPGADFGSLFKHVNNEVAGKTGYLHDTSQVHVFCSGRSFYEAILPKASLDIGFSASAMHYLSRMPMNINDHVHAVSATTSEQAEFRAVAVEDWNKILLQRSQELALGGWLVMANFCVDESGRYLGHTGGENLLDSYNDLWRGMRDQLLISDGEYRNTAFQQHYKSIEDTLAPLTDPQHEVYRSGLRLESSTTRIVACPFRKAFEEGHLSVDEFSRQFVNTHRSWTETTFRAGLLETRSEVEKQTIIDELYRRFEERVRKAPKGYGKDLVHMYLVCYKAY